MPQSPRLARGALCAAAATLAVPAVASADSLEAYNNGALLGTRSRSTPCG